MNAHRDEPQIREPGGEWQSLWDYLCDGGPLEDADTALAFRVERPAPEDLNDFFAWYLEEYNIKYAPKDTVWHSYCQYVRARGDVPDSRAEFERGLVARVPGLSELRFDGCEYWLGMRLREGGDA